MTEEYGATRVVGISLGGAAMLRLLRSKPGRFEKMIFILPAQVQEGDEAYTRLHALADMIEHKPIEEVADIILGEEEDARLIDEFPGWRERRRQAVIRMGTPGMPHAVREVLSEPVEDDINHLPKVTAPTLVIGHEGDPIHHAETARELAAALPNSELIIFDDPNAMLREIVALTTRVSSFLSAPG